MELDRGKLLSIYENIEEARKQREDYISMVQKIDEEIQIKILEYRIASVSRILDYIHSNQTKVANNSTRFDTLITHCCNKLNGNLDGIELNLGDE